MNPDFPVVNVGNRDKPVYLPVEVCEVEAGQPVKNKLSPRQTQNMLNFAVKGVVQHPTGQRWMATELDYHLGELPDRIWS